MDPAFNRSAALTALPVDQVGLEPTTTCMQGRRSSNWSYRPKRWRAAQATRQQNTRYFFLVLLSAAFSCSGWNSSQS